MRIGILGAGGMAREHAAAYVRMKGVEIAGFYGRHRGKVEATAKQFGALATTKMGRILRDGSIDAVDVVVPSGVRRDPVIAALEAGVNGYVMKTADAEEIVAAVQGHALGGGFETALGADMRVAAADGLMFATKETTYLTEAVLLVYLEVVLWQALLAQYRDAFPDATRDRRWLVAAVLLATVLLRLVLVAGVAWLLVPARRACPRCGEGQLARVTSYLAGLLRLERRWCLACGWQGVSKACAPIPQDHHVPTGRHS